MIKYINKKYCKDDLVQLMLSCDFSNLIVSADEIILLKIGDKILVNKYVEHPNRMQFPFSDKVINDDCYNELFEYNKVYLNYRASVGGYRFDKKYFFKGQDRAIFLSQGLPVDQTFTRDNSIELNRDEIEKIFDKNSYDSMYIFDRNGRIYFANNKKDGLLINKKIIPSDEEIIQLELSDRIGDYNIARAINPASNTHENYEKAHKVKTIDEIKDFNIYGSAIFNKYSHMLLTSTDGKFNLQWFRIDFIEKDKFKLTTNKVPIIEPTVDNVIMYARHNDIEYTREPSVPEVEMEEVVDNLLLSAESEIKDLEENEVQTIKNNNMVKKLSRVFKKNN